MTQTVLVVFLGLLPLALRAQGLLGSVDRFLLDRTVEVELARSAAPHDIGKLAEVWVLTRGGYELAQKGTNGFACFVGRGWSGSIMIPRGGKRVVNPEAFEPSLLAPHCFNREGARTVLQWQFAITRALMEGVPAERVADATGPLLQDGRLSAPGPGAFAYMMSPRQQLGRALGVWRPMVMLYVPFTENATWGSPGFNHDHPWVAEGGTAWAVVVIPTGTFSDGTRPLAR